MVLASTLYTALGSREAASALLGLDVLHDQPDGYVNFKLWRCQIRLLSAVEGHRRVLLVTTAVLWVCC